MSQSASLPWGERLEAFLENPILIKELSAAFRRRRFLYLLCGLLGTAGFILAGALLSADPALDASVVGRRAFGAFVTLEALIVVAVFPAFSCVSIVEERSNNRFDLLITTRLRPQQIARGKLGAALIYGGTFLIGTLPLAALTFLYGGVSVGQIALSYVSLCLLALVVTSHGLAISGLTRSAPRAVAGAFLTLPVTLAVTCTPACYLWVGPFLYAPLAQDEAWLSWGQVLLNADPLDQSLALAVPLLWILGWAWLGLVVGANGLQAESGDRATPLRLWFLGVWTPFLALGALFLSLHPPPDEDPTLLASALEVFFGAACVAFSLGGVYFATGRVDPRARPLIGWRRLVGRGPWSGAGFVLLVALASYVTAVVIVTLVPDLNHLLQRGSRRQPLEVLLWGTLWSLAFLLALTQAGVWLSRRFPPAIARAGLLAALFTCTSVPAVAWTFAPPREGGSVLHGTYLSPITVLRSITVQPHLADRRLLLFAPPARIQGASARQRARELRTQASAGLEVHKLSSAIFFGLGLFLFFLNARAYDPDASPEGRAILRIPPVEEPPEPSSEDVEPTGSDDPTPEEPTPEEPTPEEPAPEEPTPEESAAENSTAEESATEEPAPEESASDESAPEPPQEAGENSASDGSAAEDSDDELVRPARDPEET